MNGHRPLTDALPGTRVVVTRFAAELPPHQLETLMSYGLVEGRPIVVLAQQPATVVLLDHTELAMERMVATSILIADAEASDSS